MFITARRTRCVCFTFTVPMTFPLQKAQLAR